MSTVTTFRREVRAELAELVAYWRRIEREVKKVELVQHRAIIPAINELRYGARQLFNASGLFSKPALTAIEKKHVTKRLIIARQYFTNADHDVADALLKYVSDAIDEIEAEVGGHQIVVFFHGYPGLKAKLGECFALIEEARQDYDQRIPNYNRIKQQYIDGIITDCGALKDAEIRARHAIKQRDIDVKRAQKETFLWRCWSLFTSLLGIGGIVVGFWYWMHPYEKYCAKPNDSWFHGVVCEPLAPGHKI